MWWTPNGERVLRGAEWALFREGLDTLWNWVEESFADPGIYSTSTEAFDRLQPGQRLALLALVGKALSDEGTPHPDLTVVTEATVAAVFSHIAGHVCMEAELGEDSALAAGLESPEDATHWRRLVLAAHAEVEIQDMAVAREVSAAPDRPPAIEAQEDAESEGLDEPWVAPHVLSGNVDEWELLVDCLANRILWEDGDYEAEDDFLDAAPEEGHARMAMMGIADGYFTAIAYDPADEELEPIRRTLRSLCGRAEPEESESLDCIWDVHHDLHVGPCDAETLATETSNRLVEAISVFGDESFDCSLAEWTELFREDVLREGLQNPEAATPKIDLTPQQAESAARARESGEPLTIDDDKFVILRGSAWIITDSGGWVFVEADPISWASDDRDPEFPPIQFNSPEEALAAYLGFEECDQARSERYAVSMRRLERKRGEV